MTIDEAIWKLRDFRIIVSPNITEKHREAIELGIEALKYVEDAQKITAPYLARLLNGQTEQ